MLPTKDIKALAELLKPPGEDQSSSDDDDDDLPKAGISKLGPGDIKGKSKARVKIKGNAGKGGGDEFQNQDPLSIWDLSEVPEVPYSDDVISDPRMKPEVDIKFKQMVGSEDIFLQLSNKTPVTASCECMVISMSLEGELKEDIDCHLTQSHLDIRSPRYRLSLPLPHPVNADACAAEWDPQSNKLILNLVLNREYDFVNF